MLSINNLSFYFGSRALYDEASLHIKPKDRIGLIGANGTGKSTLLRLVVGEYTPDGGTISKSGDCSIGFLNQDLLSYESSESILNVAMQAFEREMVLQKKIDEVLHEMETNYRDELVDKLAKYQEEFEALDGYTIQAKAEEILEGLGFKTEELQVPLQRFSGGWRMRVMLAKLLLQKPSLLLLDEPTNHLDLPSIEWVENYVRNYEGAVMIVSHDRYFLDNCVNIIVEVSGGKLNYYPGNYSFYIEEKTLRNEIQRGAYENQQAKIRQTERFIERFKAKASKARQVQSRVKSLEKLDFVDEVIDDTARVNFKFTLATQPGKNIFQLEDVSKAYGEKRILTHTDAYLGRGDKVALIGANGKGKSTLLRIIAGTESIEGKRQIGHNVAFAFYAQHQLEALNIENTLIDELREMGTDKTEAQLRGILGCFLFSSDDVFKKIKVLSGGEKSRVALAKMLLSEANFLLLDEPTNHLDMISVNILIQALQQYEGTYVIVSHDRYFVSEVANKIWYIEDEQIKEYPGTYDEYVLWQQERESIRKESGAARTEKPVEVKVAKPQPTVSDTERKQSQQKLKKLQQQVEELEGQVSKFEKQKADTEAQLADPDIYQNTVKFNEVQKAYDRVKQQLTQANDAWESAMMEVESLEKLA
ncbi:ABC-F family ATP-binding cassette domain-containing protein [Siphonobacter sp.]|uniref:ABC-F family ATP-binding cassette domain-containing protein n=1 Tax=Siphonobacter sp. TaxID=1869184 RepID=UPI003B3B9E22